MQTPYYPTDLSRYTLSTTACCRSYGFIHTGRPEMSGRARQKTGSNNTKKSSYVQQWCLGLWLSRTGSCLQKKLSPPIACDAHRKGNRSLGSTRHAYCSFPRRLPCAGKDWSALWLQRAACPRAGAPAPHPCPRLRSPPPLVFPRSAALSRYVTYCAPV